MPCEHFPIGFKVSLKKSFLIVAFGNKLTQDLRCDTVACVIISANEVKREKSFRKVSCCILSYSRQAQQVEERVGSKRLCIAVITGHIQRHKKMDRQRQRDRGRDRHGNRDRQTERQTDGRDRHGNRDIQTDRQAERQRVRQGRDRQREK